eukprot:CAMPEP_0184389910 /NCGR_PEP_ID=MMETSP0007-20130409/12897_1 /TAXON_ID=97485 /ORGANISM="Prymnesium parvum, Strain Texoma1" /LENGTH=45 /DNA_ID= /DNA_START= /DNA_END= /DNA_ORIENTATION=
MTAILMADDADTRGVDVKAGRPEAERERDLLAHEEERHEGVKRDD